MKKIAFISFAMMAVFGCQLDEIDLSVDQSINNESEMINYHVGLDLAVDTKTYAASDHKIYWSEDDKMNIFCGINNNRKDKLVLVDGAGTKN